MYTCSYKSSYEQNIDLLGNNNTNILNMKNKVTSINSIVLQTHRESNLGLESERQEKTNSKNSIGNRNIFSEQNIELLNKTTQFNSNKNNRTIQNKVPIPSTTVNKITTAIDLRKDQYLSKISKICISTNLKEHA